ncbi:MAG: hypothetical protein WAV16_03375 [Candidatus Moraniibacteriota bacterium]
MQKNKKIIIPIVALSVLLGSGVWGINNIYANEDNPQNSIIEKIAQKFNLNKDEVQKVFDEERGEREKKMEENFNARLDEAISKGNLTEAKKALILEKRAQLQSEFQSNREANKNLSHEDREAKFKANREALEKWATDNGIDIKYLMGMGGPGRGGHGGPKQVD